MRAGRGAEGVGRATTNAVVAASVAILAANFVLTGLFFNMRGKEGLAFLCTFVAIALFVLTYFLMLFPNVMPTNLAGGTDLTIANASSSPLTLKIMTGAALVFTPIALLYTAWNYWVFRRRLTTKHIPAAQGL